ncbi:hypothetical protein HYS00_00075, partial [Candidatus Microgenomates bacterium]|nr:hypothetical protein [Candidatus Microgenomates bacterium]
MKKNLSVTIVIPTCYGGDSLISTAESLFASTNVRTFRFMIVSDRFPIKPATRKKLEKMGVLPVKNPQTFVEGAMASNIRMVYNTAKLWNGGANYLAASGRCLAFRMSLFSKFRIPEILVNADMYFLLENKRLNGKFAMLPDAKVFIRPPQKLKDQVGPSSRFQYQKEELKKFFDFNYANEYRVPMTDAIQAVMKEII